MALVGALRSTAAVGQSFLPNRYCTRGFIVGLILLAACTADPKSEDRPVRVVVDHEASFEAVFENVRRIRPVQSDEHLIAQVTSIDIDDHGYFVIADRSEGNIKLFSPDGGLIRVFGRDGSGPGEFGSLGFVRFNDEGDIWAADTRNVRLSLFDRDGPLLREVDISHVYPGISGFDVLDDGTFLIAQHRLADKDVSPAPLLTVLDEDGAVIRSLTPVAAVWPPGETRYSQYWEYFQSALFARQGNEVVVTLPISNLVWFVDLESGEARVKQFDFPGYERIEEPEDGRTFAEWMTSEQRAARPIVGQEGILLNYVSGILHYGDPTIRIVRHPEAGWLQVSGGPPVIYASRDRFITIENPLDEDLQIGIYRFR